MNANMHGAEALLGAYEATGEAVHLARAGRILDTFTAQIAPAEGWHLPEHYTRNGRLTAPIPAIRCSAPQARRPAIPSSSRDCCCNGGTVRLSGRCAGPRARTLWRQALTDGWLPATGGFAYTLGFDRKVAIPDRYWWPVTEAIGTVAMLIKAARRPEDEEWYRTLWQFAQTHMIDHALGGWFPEIGPDGKPVSTIFKGKPDIYHSIQAALFPLTPGVSRHLAHLGAI